MKNLDRLEWALLITACVGWGDTLDERSLGSCADSPGTFDNRRLDHNPQRVADRPR